MLANKPLFIIKSVFHGYMTLINDDWLDSDYTADVQLAKKMTLPVAKANRCPDSEEILNAETLEVVVKCVESRN